MTMKVERVVLSSEKVSVYVSSANCFRRACRADRTKVHNAAMTYCYVVYQVLKNMYCTEKLHWNCNLG